MKHIVLWVLRFICAGVVLGYIFSLVPLAGVVSVVAAARLHYVALALLMGIATRYAAALRMRLLTDSQGIPLSTWDIQKINLTTSFYGLLLPGSLAGGAIRWYKLSSTGKNFSGALMAMVVNRLMQTIVLAVLGLAFWMLDERARAHGFIGITIAAFLGLLLVIQLLTSNRIAAAYLTRPIVQVSFIPQSIRAVLQRLAECANQHAGLARPLLTRLWGLTVMGEVFGLASFCLFAASLQIDLSIISLGWVRCMVLMATMLPLSISGLGVRDATLIYLLDPYGVAAASSVAFSFLLLARQMLAGLLGGLVEITQWLARPRQVEPAEARECDHGA